MRELDQTRLSVAVIRALQQAAQRAADRAAVRAEDQARRARKAQLRLISNDSGDSAPRRGAQGSARWDR